jgi:folylpolyglutamate synthase/dihydropteroate synthase
VAARFLLVPIRSPRAASTADLELLVSDQLSAVQCASIQHALDAAHRFDEKILVTGSLFLVGETLAMLQSVPDTFQISYQ